MIYTISKSLILTLTSILIENQMLYLQFNNHILYYIMYLFLFYFYSQLAIILNKQIIFIEFIIIFI